MSNYLAMTCIYSAKQCVKAGWVAIAQIAGEYGECELSYEALFTLPASREFTSTQDLRGTMRSTRFYLMFLALVAIVLCTGSKGAMATQTFAHRADSIGPRRLDVAHSAGGAKPRAYGLDNKRERVMSRRVARSGQRAPDHPASLSLSPSSSSHAAGSSNDYVPNLPTPVITSDLQFAPHHAVAPDLKPDPSHADAETKTRTSPQLAKRCHYIGTFFRRSVSPLTAFAKICLRGSEAETGDFRLQQALTAMHPPIRPRSLTLKHPPEARFLLVDSAGGLILSLASTWYEGRLYRFRVASVRSPPSHSLLKLMNSRRLVRLQKKYPPLALLRALHMHYNREHLSNDFARLETDA